jgi:23S rRNA pseudouridine1911/1915/1917 synthase
LHAFTLGFKHPVTNEDMFFEAPLAKDIEQVIEKWRRYVKGRSE